VKDTIKTKIDEVNKNSTSIKDLVIMVKDDIQKDLLRIEAKIDSHIQTDDRQRTIFAETIAQHNSTLKHICDELPNKGYCTKVDQMNIALFPEAGLSLPQRVDLLMYDRAIIKWVLAASIGAIITSSVTLFLKLFYH
jgi:hypothetical protein